MSTEARAGPPPDRSPPPRLILLNGLPGSGKSTLARRFVDDHPLALCLDIDLVRGLLGAWNDQPDQAGQLARRLALAMATVHLAAGYDVIVPQFLGRIAFIHQLAALATREAARFVEVVLVNDPADPADAADRLARRAAGPLTPAQHDAHEHLDRHGGLAAPPEMRARLDEVLDQRPHTLTITPTAGQIEQTYRELLRQIT